MKFKQLPNLIVLWKAENTQKRLISKILEI